MPIDPPATVSPTASTTEEGTQGGLFRRRSPTSMKSPKSIDFDEEPSHLNNADHHSAATEEDDSGSEDLEVGGGKEAATQSNKKCCCWCLCCSRKACLIFVAWMLLAAGLSVGLFFAFNGKNQSEMLSNNKSSKSQSSSSSSSSSSAAADNENMDKGTLSPSTTTSMDYADVDTSSGRIEQKPIAPTPPANTTDDAPLISEVDQEAIFNQTNILGSDNNNDNNNNSASTAKNSTKPPAPASTTPELLEWPDLLGMPAAQAKQQLQAEFGVNTYDIIIVPHNSPVTKDLRFDRIRLFVDDAGVIVEVPRVG